MKSFLLCLLSLIFTGSAYAQPATAEDWTQNDCNGIEHNLYTELDTGSVVVMEIVMLDGCMPCINAAHLFGPIIQAYNMTNGNRIQYYSFGYNDTYTCSQLSDWKTENAITCNAQFIEGYDISEFYGGMGMPTIVVAGRSTHEVSFSQYGFTVYDTIKFAHALEYALGLTETLPIQNYQPSTISCFPNPATTVINLNNLFSGTVTIYGMGGAQLYQLNCVNGAIDIATLPKGFYLLQFEIGNTTFLKI